MRKRNLPVFRGIIFLLPADMFVYVLIDADWIKVSGAVWTTDLFTNIYGYLIRQAQAMNPAVVMKTSMKGALESCN